VKKFVLATTATLCLAVPVMAADMPVKAPPPPAVFSWTGCYLGGYVGAAWGRHVDTADPRSTGGVFPAGTFYNAPTANSGNGGLYSYDLNDNPIFGGTFGCNWQSDRWVWGLEAEGGYLRLRGDAIDPYSVALSAGDTHDDARIGNWYAALTGRFGVAFDRVLIYAKGGVGFTHLKAHTIDACNTGTCGGGLLFASESKDEAFWVAGGGVEWAFSGNWSLKGEYLYLAVDSTISACGAGAAAAAGSTFCADHDFKGVHTAKIGLNYRFGWPF
jgi:outer membrane immunogenic protein